MGNASRLKTWRTCSPCLLVCSARSDWLSTSRIDPCGLLASACSVSSRVVVVPVGLFGWQMYIKPACGSAETMALTSCALFFVRGTLNSFALLYEAAGIGASYPGSPMTCAFLRQDSGFSLRIPVSTPTVSHDYR